MTISLCSFVGFNPVSRSCVGSSVRKFSQVSTTPVLTNSNRAIKCKRGQSHLLVAESDRIITDHNESSKNDGSAISSQGATPTTSQFEKGVTNELKLPTSEAPAGSSSSAEQENQKSPSPDAKSAPKKVPLTARERLRAARALSRYSESKPAKSEMGRSVLDALRESEKGKKGLPEAPTNLFDDSKRGLPKPGLTFNFPGGFDLFIIAFSFVFISTVMFATTYIVWKVGAIHFNEY